MKIIIIIMKKKREKRKKKKKKVLLFESKSICIKYRKSLSSLLGKSGITKWDAYIKINK